MIIKRELLKKSRINQPLVKLHRILNVSKRERGEGGGKVAGTNAGFKRGLTRPLFAPPFYIKHRILLYARMAQMAAGFNAAISIKSWPVSYITYHDRPRVTLSFDRTCVWSCGPPACGEACSREAYYWRPGMGGIMKSKARPTQQLAVNRIFPFFFLDSFILIPLLDRVN